MTTARKAEVPSLVGYLLVATVILLPAWGNRGPASSSPVDVLLLSLAGWWCWDAVRRWSTTAAPYTLPVLLSLTAGAVAGALGRYPGGAVIALAQDAFLLLAALAMTRIVTAPGPWARRVAVGWVAGAVAWSLPVLASAAGLVPASAWGVLVTTSNQRAFGTFANPNLAGSYYAVSFFVVLAVIRPWRLRVLLAAVPLAALALTGSLAAIAGTGLGLLVLATRHVVRSLAPGAPRRARTAVALMVAGVTALAGLTLGGPALASVPQQFGGDAALHNSFGRLHRSDSSRFYLWSLGLNQLGGNLVVGVGPTAASPTLRGISDSGKSLHSDVLASLLERGLAGIVALFLLIGGIAVAGWRLAKRTVPWLVAPAALSVAALSIVPGLLTHEVLHFRHVWLLLGLLIGARAIATPRPLERT